MPLRNSDFEHMYGEAMADFVKRLRVEDLANLHVPSEPNPVKGERSHISGHKGGHPPVDYSAVEALVDMKAALKDGNFREAYSLYVTLMRLTNA